jgi:hypothetical protein
VTSGFSTWWGKVRFTVPSYYSKGYPCSRVLTNAKEIWGILKTAHDEDKVTKITKSEMIEEELG